MAMGTNSQAIRRLLTIDRLARRRASLVRMRAQLADGASTTVHVAAYERASFTARVVAFERPEPLARWCRRSGVRHAVVGGFFHRPEYLPLGELRIGGRQQPGYAFHPPWQSVRA